MADRSVNSRTLWRVIALSLGLFFLGVVGLVAVSRGGGAGRQFSRANPEPTPRPSGAADAGGPGPDAKAPADIAATGLSPMGRAKVQYVDKADPTRILGLIEWAQIDPLPLGRSIVKRPRATVFLSPSARVVITAETGTLVARPPALEPESGVFEGNVTARYYIVPPSASGEPAPLPAGSTPAVEFNTASIAFDLPLGEVTSAGAFTLVGSGIDAAGSGLRVVANQVLGRIELFRVERTTRLVLSPSGLRALSESLQASAAEGTRGPRTGASGSGGTSADGGNVASVAGPARATIYRLLLGADLIVSSGSVALDAARLEAFFTVIDGKIAPGAIAPLTMFSRGASRAQSGDATDQDALSGSGSAPSIAPRQTGEQLAAAPRDAGAFADEISVAFSGPLDLRPVSKLPDELAGQLAGARVLGDRSPAEITLTPVKQSQGNTTRVSFAEGWYGATKPLLTLARGLDPVRGNVEQATVSCEKLTADLVGGTFSLRGPGLAAGEMESRGGKESESGAQDLVGPRFCRTLEWSDQLDVGLLVSNGLIGQQLTMAVAQGDVRVTDRYGTAGGGVIHLDFKVPVAIARQTQSSTPNRITLSDNAQLAATDPSEGTLRGQTIVIDLGPEGSGAGGRGIAVRQVMARGTNEAPATANRRGVRLSANLIDATLANDEVGNPALRTVHAESNVSFANDRGIFARADRLDVSNAESQVIDLSGREVALGRGGQTQGGLEITGTQMRLDGLRRELYVHGPGRLMAYAKPAALGPEGDGGTTLDAVWSEFMRFDDEKGNAEARGSTVAVARRGTAESDTMRAEALKMTFEPSTAGAASGLLGNQVAPEGKLMLIEAIGRSVSETGAPRATVEVRRFAAAKQSADGAPVADGELEQLLFLEGDRILVSPSTATLEVPGPGQLLVDDHRTRSAPVESLPGASAQPLFSPGRAGTSLFTWTGSLNFQRRAGLVRMREGVRLLQRARGAEAPISLTCGLIEARLRPLLPGVPAGTTGTGFSVGSEVDVTQQLGGELRSVAAVEAVEVVTPDRKRLNAGRVDFDAEQQIITAFGDTVASLEPSAPTADPARVSFLDPTKPAPLIARALRWFVQSGRVEIIEPMPLSGSR